MRLYPPLVSKLVNCFDAWIVGSAALPDQETTRDIDIVVSHSVWNRAAQLIPKDAKVNSFGGWKFLDDGIEVDIWPEDLNNLMTNHFFTAAYHPRSNTRVVVTR